MREWALDSLRQFRYGFIVLFICTVVAVVLSLFRISSAHELEQIKQTLQSTNQSIETMVQQLKEFQTIPKGSLSSADAHLLHRTDYATILQNISTIVHQSGVRVDSFHFSPNEVGASNANSSQTTAGNGPVASSVAPANAAPVPSFSSTTSNTAFGAASTPPSYPVDITVTGTLHQVLSFLRRLESLPQLTTIQSLTTAGPVYARDVTIELEYLVYGVPGTSSP